MVNPTDDSPKQGSSPSTPRVKTPTDAVSKGTTWVVNEVVNGDLQLVGNAVLEEARITLRRGNNSTFFTLIARASYLGGDPEKIVAILTEYYTSIRSIALANAKASIDELGRFGDSTILNGTTHSIDDLRFIDPDAEELTTLQSERTKTILSCAEEVLRDCLDKEEFIREEFLRSEETFLTLMYAAEKAGADREEITRLRVAYHNAILIYAGKCLQRVLDEEWDKRKKDEDFKIYIKKAEALQADQQELARLSSRYITHTLIPARAFLEEFERFGYGRFADGEQIFISSREKAKSFNPNATELIELKAEYVRILLVQARKSLDAFKSEGDNYNKDVFNLYYDKIIECISDSEEVKVLRAECDAFVPTAALMRAEAGLDTFKKNGGDIPCYENHVLSSIQYAEKLGVDKTKVQEITQRYYEVVFMWANYYLDKFKEHGVCYKETCSSYIDSLEHLGVASEDIARFRARFDELNARVIEPLDE